MVKPLTLSPIDIKKENYELGLFDKISEKINELVDAVNKLETMAKNTNTVLKSLVEENNIHEKQIDELQMKLEPHKCEPTENFTAGGRIRIDGLDDPFPENGPEPIKLYVCGDGSVYDNLDVAKSHAASIFNPLPGGATTTDRVYLEQELIRTRKALETAVSALKYIQDGNLGFSPAMDFAEKALEQITALTKGGDK